jgi:hypothetical protein
MGAVSLLDKFTGGGITKLFGGKTDEQQREERRRRYVDAVRQTRAQTLARQNELFAQGVKSVRETITAATEGSRQAAARRAKAMGHGTDVEAFVNPSEQAMMGKGAEALKGYQLAGQRELENTAEYYSNLELGAERDFAERPIDPGITDFAGELGAGLVQYDQNRQLIDALNPSVEGQQAPTTPALPGGYRFTGSEEATSPETLPGGYRFSGSDQAAPSKPMNPDLLTGPSRATTLSEPMSQRPSLFNWNAYNQRKRRLSF